jgi:hypothetical protein
LKLAKVPVIVAVGLTPAQVKAYRIADNKTNELAEWDFGVLAEEIKELKAMDFNVDLLAFDADEIEKILGPTATKRRHLRALGYYVINIPHWSYSINDPEQTKLSYIYDMVHSLPW